MCTIHKENKSCIWMATRTIFSPRTKHIVIKYNHFKYNVKKGRINIKYISQICKMLIFWWNRLKMLLFFYWGIFYVAGNEWIILLFVILFRTVTVSWGNARIHRIKRDRIFEANRDLSIYFLLSSCSWILLVFIHVLRPYKRQREVNAR